MKKFLLALAGLLAVVAGLFIWKGGHHAAALSAQLEPLMDADAYAVTVSINDLTFSGDLTEMEGAGEDVWCVTVDGMEAYLTEQLLILDNGRAYSIQELHPRQWLSGDRIAGLLLSGRITKDGEVYTFASEKQGISCTAMEIPGGWQFTAACSVDGEAMDLTMDVLPKQEEERTVPKTVLDAMVLAQMEPPVSILEPLEVLLPAAKSLIPMEAEVKLSLECGILSISDDAVLSMTESGVTVERNGIRVDLPVPENASPLGAALVLLRDAQMERTGEDAIFRMTISAETTCEMVAAMIPQTRELAIAYEPSQVVIVIRTGKLESASMEAGGSIPFLVADIPVQVRIDLQEIRPAG